MHTKHFYPSSVRLTAGEAIDTSGMTIRQTDELTERLRDAIAAMLSAEPAGSTPA